MRVSACRHISRGLLKPSVKNTRNSKRKKGVLRKKKLRDGKKFKGKTELVNFKLGYGFMSMLLFFIKAAIISNVSQHAIILLEMKYCGARDTLAPNDKFQ